jgi:hypothetical protein
VTGRTAALLLIGVGLADPVAAQGTVIPDTRLGDRVRVESAELAGIRVIGPLVEANQGFVIVAVGDDGEASVKLPWVRITVLDRAAERPRRKRAARGALVGFGAALLAAPPLFDQEITDKAAGVNLGVVAAIGLPVTGALVGFVTAPRRWQMIDWRPSIDTVLPEGESVRLRLPDNALVAVRSNRRTFTARILSTGDSLSVRVGSNVRTLPWDAVTDLKLHGHRDRWRGAAVGVTVMGIYSGLYVQRHSLVRTARPAEFVLQRIAVGGLVGALIGTRGWARMPLPGR